MNSSLPAVSKQQNNTLPAERPVKRNIVRMIGEVDRPLLLIIVALICIGLVMIFSSSYAHAETRYGDSYRLIKSQLRAALIGLAAMLLVTRLDYRIIKITWGILYTAVTVKEIILVHILKLCRHI